MSAPENRFGKCVRCEIPARVVEADCTIDGLGHVGSLCGFCATMLAMELREQWGLTVAGERRKGRGRD